MGFSGGRSFFLMCIAFICLSACSTTRKVQVSNTKGLSRCHQANTFNYASIKPVPLHQMKVSPALLARFDHSSLNIANAFGFLQLLNQYIEAENNNKGSPSIESRIQKMEASIHLSEQISLASLEVSAFASELDCEEEYITQIADFLKAKEKQRESRLTVGAIVVGAIGGVASGMLSASGNTGNSGDYVGIATGITETILGILIFKNNKVTELIHQRNALRDIWFGQQDSEIFPPSIWYYLNYKAPENAGYSTVRERIIERWKEFQQVDADAFELKYLKEKGVYDTEELYNRAKMYDQIESYVKMIKQDLTKLSQQLERK